MYAALICVMCVESSKLSKLLIILLLLSVVLCLFYIVQEREEGRLCSPLVPSLAAADAVRIFLPPAVQDDVKERRVQKVLIVSTWRSGSSTFAGILASHKGTLQLHCKCICVHCTSRCIHNTIVVMCRHLTISQLGSLALT